MPPRDDKPVKLLRQRLDAAGVDAHLRSLAARALHIELRIQGARDRQSDASPASLETLGRRLVAGEIAAMQIRYFEGGAWWLDTLMVAKEGFRLVRLREGS